MDNLFWFSMHRNLTMKSSPAFKGEVHRGAELDSYDFAQVFGARNEELQALAKSVASYVFGSFFLSLQNHLLVHDFVFL